MEVWGDFLGDWGDVAGREVVGGGVGDHQGVVGEEVGGREEEFDAVLFGLGGEGLAEGGVGADSTADGNGAATGLAGGFEEFAGQHIHDGGLKRGAEVGKTGLRGRAVFFQKDADRGFETAEAEIEIPRLNHAAWELEPLRIAIGGEAVDKDAARVAEAEEFGRFVESLAGGVVERAAEELVSAETFDIEKQGVAPADDERGVRRDGVPTEKWREQMALDMVHGEESFSRAEREAFGERGSDEQGGGEAWAGGGGDGVEFGKVEAGFLHGAVDDERGTGEMVARGDFGNHTAKLGMDFGLAENLVRANLAKPRQHGGGGFVAGSFDGEDRRHGGQLFLA